ncbi:putative sodium-coupled neutral amino acid transporter 10 [Zootermopsis nevadensis]|uniref:putative sodium-coupled neutral amino acid transporter 10 n=1 Tax=Zootermopsis nevadensis TaxID=136037 RepID=UPI000B8E806F|nr:putative sodium-coupled neutral amino acid transporter 10 [Zootermopsis nevadensis]
MGTNTGTVMTLANSIIGVGVLAMPFCFKQCGIILSVLMLLLSSFLSRLACHFLLKAAIMARRRNFEFLAFHTFGPSGKTIVELCIIGFLMGTCIAFFVVVGDLGPAIAAKTLNISNTASLRDIVLIGLAVFVVLPLGLLRNVDSLSSVCAATIGFYLCLVLKVMAEAMPHLAAGDWMENVYLWRPAGMLQCIPIFSMALFCQTQLFEIYESLPNASLDKMNDVIRAAVSLCTAFYICVGFFGYVAFCTQNFTGNILMSFTPTLMSDIIKMGFVLSVAVSFPLAIFPCRASLYSLLFKRVQMPHHETLSSHIPETRFKCLTIGIISMSLTVGLLIPNIELVLGLVGSTIGVLICVMFPAVAFISISTKNTQERLLAQVLVFIGVIILVLGTYATLYAANEPGNAGRIEAVSPVPDHFDSIARMTLVELKKPVANEIVADKLTADEKSKVRPKDSTAELKQQPVLGNIDTNGQNLPIQQVDLPKKPHVRQEPPVPVEPQAVPSAAVAEKKDIIPPVLQDGKQQIEDAAYHDSVVNKDAAVGLSEEKKILPDSPAEKEKGNSEQVNLDAIKKEDEELAEAEKQAEADNEQKHKELLRKLEKHKEEQKKLLQEQKQILEQLKEHKKDIEQAAAKQRNDNSLQGPSGKDLKVNGVKPEHKSNEKNQLDDKDKQSPEVVVKNIPTSQSGVPVVKMEENKIKVPSDIQKPQNQAAQQQTKVEKKDLLHQPVKFESAQKIAAAAAKPNHGNEILQETQAQGFRHQDKKAVGSVQSQDGPVSAPNKLPLPLPLAVRDNTSRFYKKSDVTEQIKKAGTVIDFQKEIKQNMQQSVADVDEAKVMRRDILANDENSFKANMNQDNGGVNSEFDAVRKTKQKYIPSNSVSNDKLYDDGKNESHEREKRNVLLEEFSDKNTFMVASAIDKGQNKQDISNVVLEDEKENCEAGEKVDKTNGVETLNMALLSKDKYNVKDYHIGDMKDQESSSLSNKEGASSHISDLGLKF